MRKQMKKLVLVLVAGVLGIGLLAGCGAGTSNPSASVEPSTSASAASPEGAMKGVTLKVGTSGLFGPFSYFDTDGKTLIGFDIDLIYALQKVLGFEIAGNQIQAMDYSALTTSVAQGKLDLAAAALCVTDERKQVIDFSRTYQDSGQVVMINSENDEGITGAADLAGKTVAVEKGTASHAYAQKNLANSTIQVHDTITTAYLALEEKKVDAVIQDGPGAAFYIKTTSGTKLKVVGDEFNQGQAPYALAFTKGSPYVDLFNAALDKLKADGTMTELENKWCK